MGIVASGVDRSFLVVSQSKAPDRQPNRACAFQKLPSLKPETPQMQKCPKEDIVSGDRLGRFAAISSQPPGLKILQAGSHGWKTLATLTWNEEVRMPSFNPIGTYLLFKYGVDSGAI
jgi:hypothetical protein